MGREFGQEMGETTMTATMKTGMGTPHDTDTSTTTIGNEEGEVEVGVMDHPIVRYHGTIPPMEQKVKAKAEEETNHPGRNGFHPQLGPQEQPEHYPTENGSGH